MIDLPLLNGILGIMHLRVWAGCIMEIEGRPRLLCHSAVSADACGRLKRWVDRLASASRDSIETLYSGQT